MAGAGELVNVRISRWTCEADTTVLYNILYTLYFILGTADPPTFQDSQEIVYQRPARGSSEIHSKPDPK